MQKSVLDIVKSKYPHAHSISPAALPEGNTDFSEVHPVMFDQLTAFTIQHAALHTKGAQVPLALLLMVGDDSASASHDRCHALAFMASLCTTFAHSNIISPSLACCLIAFNKCPVSGPSGSAKHQDGLLPKLSCLLLGVISRMLQVQSNYVLGKLLA